MAYIEARPRAYGDGYSNSLLHSGASATWNPRQQEVIVINDSPTPEPAPYRNLRTAPQQRLTSNASNLWNLQDRFDETDETSTTMHEGLAPYASHHQYQCDHPPPGFPYSSSSGGPVRFTAVPLTAIPITHIPCTEIPPGAIPLTVFPLTAVPFTARRIRDQNPNAQVFGSSKRKRHEVVEYPQRSEYGRNVTYTALSSGSGRHTRLPKNREVVLRKEVDYPSEPEVEGIWDDKEGHYKIVPRSSFTSRYQIEALLGQGTFGKVVRAFDFRNRHWVAIKIIRAIQKYRDASMIELRVLRTLQENDPNNKYNCIHLQDCFDYRNHVCIVTQLLDVSIFDFLKENNFAPFPKRHIQHFANQLFESVAFLHGLNLIHTDLKPENILLVCKESVEEPYQKRYDVFVNRKVLVNSELRLIDFGSATFQDEYHSNVVSTRHYRAPEIILGMGWSFPCDVWSIGCILIEFFTGDALFQTHDNLEHLAMMEGVCGRIEGRIIRSCSKIAQKFFRPSGRLDYPNQETSRDSRRYVKQMRPLTEMFPRTSDFDYHFCDLLQQIFRYDPKERITAKQALKHPFFTRSFSCD